MSLSLVLKKGVKESQKKQIKKISHTKQVITCPELSTHNNTSIHKLKYMLDANVKGACD